MDLGPNPDEIEKPGARLGRIMPSGWENRRSGGLVGETSGDALINEIGLIISNILSDLIISNRGSI
jgi:hypothetical protein